MAKQTSKQSPRLSVPPPGTLAYADGGAVRQESLESFAASTRIPITQYTTSVGIWVIESVISI